MEKDVVDLKSEYFDWCRKIKLFRRNCY